MKTRILALLIALGIGFVFVSASVAQKKENVILEPQTPIPPP